MIESIGYERTIAPDVPWARMQHILGARYAVVGQADCRVTPLADGTREVSVGVGYAGGWGVLDQITAPVVVPVAPVTAGIGYSLIVLHRDWGSRESSIIAITAPGATLPATLPARATTPGVVDDQPLALVALAANDTRPTIVYDLRACGGPSVFNLDPGLANLPAWFGYLAAEGVTVHCGNRAFYRRLGTWIDLSVPARQLNPSGEAVTGFARGGVTQQAIDDGSGGIDLYVELRQTTADQIYFGTPRGHTRHRQIYAVRAGMRPWADQPIDIEFREAGSIFGASGHIRTNGAVMIVSGPPAATVRRSTTQTATEWDLRFSTHYRKAS